MTPPPPVRGPATDADSARHAAPPLAAEADETPEAEPRPPVDYTSPSAIFQYHWRFITFLLLLLLLARLYTPAGESWLGPSSQQAHPVAL